MHRWLKMHRGSYDKNLRDRAGTTPTREYLQRKFNSTKRTREVNFFKQAQKIQVDASNPQPIDQVIRSYVRPASNEHPSSGIRHHALVQMAESGCTWPCLPLPFGVEGFSHRIQTQTHLASS